MAKLTTNKIWNLYLYGNIQNWPVWTGYKQNTESKYVCHFKYADQCGPLGGFALKGGYTAIYLNEYISLLTLNDLN